MSESKKRLVMSAVLFRNIFIGLFVALLILEVAFSVFGIKRLQATANDVRSVVAQADVIDQTNNQTVALWNELQQNQQSAKRVEQVVAESKSYVYQDVIVRDLKSFAEKAGITITNYDFTADTSGGASSSASPPSSARGSRTDPSADPATTRPRAEGTTAAPTASLKTTSVNITVETPVDYRNLLRFIHYIEQNLTKMQISQISLSRTTSGDQNAVMSEALTIEVYIK